MTTTLDDIVDTFELLGDWDQRYAYLIELGESLPPLPEERRIDANKVKGCMSQVWVSPCHNEDNTISFYGDCDTSIIKGVLALLIELTSNRKLEEIQKLDVDEFFERLSLGDHLSPTRHVGIYAIVELMKKLATELESSESTVS